MFAFLVQTTDSLDLSQYFVSLGALAGLVIIITEFIKKIKAITDAASWIKQIISWIVSLGLAFAGNYFQLGIFANLSTTLVIVYSVAVGLIANGIFDVTLVQALLNLFKKKES